MKDYYCLADELVFEEPLQLTSRDVDYTIADLNCGYLLMPPGLGEVDLDKHECSPRATIEHLR